MAAARRVIWMLPTFGDDPHVLGVVSNMTRTRTSPERLTASQWEASAIFQDLDTPNFLAKKSCLLCRFCNLDVFSTTPCQKVANKIATQLTVFGPQRLRIVAHGRDSREASSIVAFRILSLDDWIQDDQSKDYGLKRCVAIRQVGRPRCGRKGVCVALDDDGKSIVAPSDELGGTMCWECSALPTRLSLLRVKHQVLAANRTSRAELLKEDLHAGMHTLFQTQTRRRLGRDARMSGWWCNPQNSVHDIGNQRHTRAEPWLREQGDAPAVHPHPTQKEAYGKASDTVAVGGDFCGQSALAKQINVRTPSGKLTDTLLSDIRTGVKAVNVDLDGCESAIWMKADSDFDEDDGTTLHQRQTSPDFECQNLRSAYEEPSSVGHPLRDSLIVSSPPGSLPRTASAVDNTDPSAEETRAELLDGALLSVSYGERIHKTDVDEAERFGSIWRMDAAVRRFH
ncbi:uncharacterized protein ARMOST_18110 [Armillaria ostoyae]|uniref:Uncharacterized protein n=1 Tax=Armillaria ostoyae TaxID=47428 RepID=A0A284S0W1_ARMOS|nr:uncharacterized protein ARMOST_18110 [Armillaria ostoyae]